MNYGTRLKSLRTYDLITQKEIANYLKISEKTYGLYETQEKIIPLKHLNALCNYFNVSIDYMLGLSPTKQYEKSKENINLKTLSNRLKKFRKENNITLTQLANKINAHYTTLSNYENGKNLISTSFLYDLCKNYHISADYLLGKINS